MILLVDNRDSFTFNLADAVRSAGSDVVVVRNDMAAGEVLARALGLRAAILISPGPGGPGDAGCCLELISLAKGRLPLVGICLGHQAIVAEAGGLVALAAEPCHGRCATLDHRGTGPFATVASPMRIGRYHSLCTPISGLPRRFTVDAAIEGMAMAVRDDEAGQLGLQFHPESILTPCGGQLVAGVLAWARERQAFLAATLHAA